MLNPANCISHRKYLIQITIQQIQIGVRFPCAVSASFRVGKQQKQSRLQVSLVNSKAELREKFQIMVLFEFDTNKLRFIEKKGQISVFLITNGRKNIAGTCVVDLVEAVKNSTNRTVVGALTKCPDANAKIEYRVKATFLSQTDLFENQNTESQNKGMSPNQYRLENTHTPLMHHKSASSPQNLQFYTPNRQIFDKFNHKLEPSEQYPQSQALTVNKLSEQRRIENQNTERLQLLKKKIMQSRQQVDAQQRQSTSHITKKRQVYYKGELKKMSQRVGELTMEKEKLISQMEVLRQAYQQNQLKSQRYTRENQRMVQQERIRGEQRLAQLQESYREINQLLKAQNSNLHQQTNQANIRAEHFQRQLVEKDKDKARILQQAQSAKTQLVKEKLQRASLQQEFRQQAETIIEIRSKQKAQVQPLSLPSSPKSQSSTFGNLSRQIEKYAMQMKVLCKRNTQLQKLIDQTNNKLENQVNKNNDLSNNVERHQRQIEVLKCRCQQIRTQIKTEEEAKYQTDKIQLKNIKILLEEKNKAIAMISRDYQQRIRFLEQSKQSISQLLHSQRKLYEQYRAKQTHFQQNRIQQISTVYEQKIKHFQDANKERMQYLHQRNQNLEEIKEDLQSKILKCQNQIEMNSVQAMDNKILIDTLAQREEHTKQQLTIKEYQLKQRESQNNKLKQLIRQSEDKIIRGSLQSQDLVRKLQNQVKQNITLTKEVKDLKDKINELLDSNHQIAHKIAQSALQTNRAKQKQSQLTSKFEQISSQYEIVNKKYIDLQQLYQSLELQFKETFAELQTKSKNIDEETSKKATEKQEKKSIHQKFRIANGQKQRLKQQLRVRQVQCLSLKELLVSRDQQLTCLQRQLQCRAVNLNEIEELKQQNSYLKHQVSKIALLESTITTLQSQVAEESSLRILLSTKQRQLSLCQTSLQQSSSLITKFSLKIKDLMVQYTRLQDDSKQKDRIIEQIRKRNVEMRGEMMALQDKLQIERWEKQGVLLREREIKDQLQRVTQTLTVQRTKVQQEDKFPQTRQFSSPTFGSSPRICQHLPSARILAFQSAAIQLMLQPSGQQFRTSFISHHEDLEELTNKYEQMKAEYERRIEYLKDQLNSVMVENDLLSQKLENIEGKVLFDEKSGNSFDQIPQNSPIDIAVIAPHLHTISQQSSSTSQVRTPVYLHSPTSLSAHFSIAYRQSLARESQLKSEVQHLTSINRTLIQKVQVLYGLIMKNKSSAVNHSPSKSQTTAVLMEFKELQGKAIEIMQYTRRIGMAGNSTGKIDMDQQSVVVNQRKKTESMSLSPPESRNITLYNDQ